MRHVWPPEGDGSMNALALLWQILPHDRGYHELRLEGERVFCDVTDQALFRRLLGGVAKLGSHCDLSAVPRLNVNDSLSVGHASVLWARLDSGRSCELLQRFEPEPTLVLRDGGTLRRTALWALSRPLNYDWTLRANRRIAHRLGSKKKLGEPSFMFPAPGSLVNGKRVFVEHASEGFYEPAQVVGQLPDAPDQDAWRRAA